MKFRWIAVAGIVALAAAAGAASYFCFRAPAPLREAGEHDSLLWLRREFRLSSEQMARIETMHADYQIVCEDHCRDIRDARVALQKLRAASAPAETIAEAEAKTREVDLICTTSLKRHMREIAAVIGGEQGTRYLSIVLPRIAKFDHAKAPQLDLAPHAGHSAH